jgi:hypothetical protein
VCAERVVAIPTYGGRAWGRTRSAAANSWGIAARTLNEARRIAASTTDKNRVAASATADTRSASGGWARNTLPIRVLVVAVAATRQKSRRPARDDCWRYAYRPS